MYDHNPHNYAPGALVPAELDEIHSLPIGTLLTDRTNCGLVKHDRNEWAVYDQDAQRWLVLDDGEVLGEYTGSASFPATIDYMPEG